MLMTLISRNIQQIGIFYVVTLAACIALIFMPVIWPVVAGLVFIVHFGFLGLLSWVLFHQIARLTPAAQTIMASVMILICCYLCFFFVMTYVENYNFSWLVGPNGETFEVILISDNLEEN